MKAVRIHQYGGPEVLVYEDVPIPEPGSTQVLVRVEAASVNPVDVAVRENRFPTPKSRPRRWAPTAPASSRPSEETSPPCDRRARLLQWSRRRQRGQLRGLRADRRDAGRPVCRRPSRSWRPPPSAWPIPPPTTAWSGAATSGRRDGTRPGRGRRRRLGLRAARQGLRRPRHRDVAGAAERDLVRGLGADETIDYLREDVVARASNSPTARASTSSTSS